MKIYLKENNLDKTYFAVVWYVYVDLNGAPHVLIDFDEILYFGFFNTLYWKN